METDVVELPLSDRLLAWFVTNKKQALWGATVILGVGLIIGFLTWRKGEKEIEAGEALSAAAVPYSSGMLRGDAAEAYLKVAANYPGSKAATRALLLAAGDSFASGNFDKSKSLFEQFRREHGDNPLVGQALLGIAACLEGQGKTSEAIAAYKDLAEHRPNDSATPQAKFAMANLYEAQNKPEQALAQFEDVVKGDPFGSLGSEAGIRAEELKQKYPNLVPPPSPPASVTPMVSPLKTPMLTNLPSTGTLRSVPLSNAAPAGPKK